MTEENITMVKAAITAFFGALTALWGWFGWLVVLWGFLMAVDFGTGFAAALHNGEWESKIAREGILHKAGCIAAVLVSGVMDIVIGIVLREMTFMSLPFSYTVLLCPIVLIWYILTESGSIIENIGKMGAPMPEFLAKAIAALKSSTDKIGSGAFNDEKK